MAGDRHGGQPYYGELSADRHRSCQYEVSDMGTDGPAAHADQCGGRLRQHGVHSGYSAVQLIYRGGGEHLYAGIPEAVRQTVKGGAVQHFQAQVGRVHIGGA